MEIGGSIDTSNIERGLTRVETGFKGVEAVGKGVNSDFERMNQKAVRLGKAMGVMALAGGGAMLALAKGSPAVAGAMAKIKVTAGKLSRTLGEVLRPAFNAVSESFQGFVGWIDEHKGSINSFIVDQLDRMGYALGGIKGVWDDISGGVSSITKSVGIDFDIMAAGSSILKNLSLPVIAGIVTKFVGGKLGMAAAGPIGLGVGGLAATVTGDKWTQVGGLIGLTGGLAMGGLGAPVGMAGGAALGAIIDAILAGLNRKNQTLSSPDHSMGGA